jgi:hypothetical protein
VVAVVGARGRRRGRAAAVGGDDCGVSIRRRVVLFARQCANAQASTGSRGGLKVVSRLGCT